MTLMLHAGATPVSYDDLRSVVTPLGTRGRIELEKQDADDFESSLISLRAMKSAQAA
jgi:hypothetical protein